MEVQAKILKTSKTDIVEKIVRVEREGFRTTDNQAMLVDLRNVTHFSKTFEISLPEEDRYIKNSVEIEAAAIGDLLGPAFTNIQNLM